MAEPLPGMEDWLSCERCQLCDTRSNVVLGVGHPKAEVMIVGEGPGPREDEAGVPFDGASGVELNKFIGRLQWEREDLFIDNIVSCWPVDDDGERLVTRKPGVDELKACWPRISETIYRVDPLVIIALGAAALKGLTGSTTKISAARGDLFFAEIPGMYKKVRYPVFPTFHPAYLLRQGADSRQNTPKRLFWDDLCRIREHLLKLKSFYR